MNAPVRLSVAIITYNEEKRIEACLDSVKGLADEILVLDSHSKDRTREICEKIPGLRFEVHDFDGHVQQKNRAIEQCRGEWVLSIDADERVTPALAGAIHSFLDSAPVVDGARIRRLTWHLGRPVRHGGWYNARIRLIRKGKGVWGGENPHDEIHFIGENRKAPLLDGDLIHYSFIDLSDQVDTINRFSSIVAFNRAGRRKRFSLWKLILKPVSKFLEIYLVKRGFLDGMPGLIIAVSSSYSTFLKWAKLWEIQKTGQKRPSNVRPDYRVQTGGDSH